MVANFTYIYIYIYWDTETWSVLSVGATAVAAAGAAEYADCTHSCRKPVGWLVGWLVGFYGISTIVGYSMPHSVYTSILNVYDL